MPQLGGVVDAALSLDGEPEFFLTEDFTFSSPCPIVATVDAKPALSRKAPNMKPLAAIPPYILIASRLTIRREFRHWMGDDLTAQSEAGNGSTFLSTMPQTVVESGK